MVELAEYIVESISQNPEAVGWALVLSGPAAIGCAAYGASYGIEKASNFLSSTEDEGELRPDLLEEDPETDGVPELEYEDEY